MTTRFCVLAFAVIEAIIIFGGLYLYFARELAHELAHARPLRDPCFGNLDLMTTPDLNAIRQSVLSRMEQHERNVKLAIVGAALAEAALLALVLWRIDFSNRFESTVFMLFVLSYTIIALGLIALGAHVSRVGARVLSALDAAAPGPSSRL